MKDWDEMSEREKDAWVAQHVLELDVQGQAKPSIEVLNCWIDLPHYTTDISAAWKVVEHIHANIANVTTLECDSSIGRWTFSLAKGAIVGVGDTAPLAISHAAYLSSRHHQMRELAHEIADRNAEAMRRLAEGDSDEGDQVSRHTQGQRQVGVWGSHS